MNDFFPVSKSDVERLFKNFATSKLRSWESGLTTIMCQAAPVAPNVKVTTYFVTMTMQKNLIKKTYPCFSILRSNTAEKDLASIVPTILVCATNFPEIWNIFMMRFNNLITFIFKLSQ